MSFPVHKNWSQEFPYFCRPAIVGYFSLNQERKMHLDSSKLSYLYHRLPLKTVNFDLNKGIDIVQRKPDNPERINHLLKWIMSNFDKILANPCSGRWLLPHFICYRGLLTKIAKTPYDLKEGWIICAAKWRGNIYLCLFETEEEKIEKATRTEKQWRFMSWGFKFEQYMVSDSPDKPPDTSKAVNEAEEFNCVFQTQLIHHHLLYAAEMDALLSDKKLVDPLPLDKLQFIELKTNRIIESSQQNENLKKFKLLRWWCQSFLVGTERIICGFRDDRGIVKELKDFRVSSIARYSKNMLQKLWFMIMITQSINLRGFRIKILC
ncbi:decapping and exoribonuclease protein-like isoform X2 [Chelonus insularis]|uniref:decapping and exoribonuclease protein-like isoform X2 n=1 Tax=Chelonus insularis TaxID=460826 RepID=UPI00158B2E47|nr:decapping and exoribonuclease protein-like isoform X2 [Chelonus insularis]